MAKKVEPQKVEQDLPPQAVQEEFPRVEPAVVPVPTWKTPAFAKPVVLKLFAVSCVGYPTAIGSAIDESQAIALYREAMGISGTNRCDVVPQS